MASSRPWRCSASGDDGFYHTLAVGDIDVVDDHLGALGGQALGDALAETAARAGDDDGFVVNAHGEFFRKVGSTVAKGHGF
jgi:hypothetical protein